MLLDEIHPFSMEIGELVVKMLILLSILTRGYNFGEASSIVKVFKRSFKIYLFKKVKFKFVNIKSS